MKQARMDYGLNAQGLARIPCAAASSRLSDVNTQPAQHRPKFGGNQTYTVCGAELGSKCLLSRRLH